MSSLTLFRLIVLSSLLLTLGMDRPVWSDDNKSVENSIGMKLMRIPKGKCTMGSPESEKGRRADEKQREVVISSAFCMGAHEVTQGQFEKIMGFNPSYFSTKPNGKEGVDYLLWSKPGGGKDKLKGVADTSGFPVENVSWDEAVEFCKKLSARPEEAPETYPTGM